MICFLFQMQHGRRTASLKASYEAVTKNADITKDLLLGRDGATSSTTPTTEHVTKSSRKKYVIKLLYSNKSFVLFIFMSMSCVCVNRNESMKKYLPVVPD